jgi:hypothetical protein
MTTTKSRDVRSTTTLLIPASYTVQEVFGFPSTLPLAGFAPGHPLVPKSTPGYVWDSKIAKDFIEWLTEPNPDPLWIHNWTDGRSSGGNHQGDFRQ